MTFLQAPTRSDLLEGRWRLLYTSRPGTASPIQQTFVGVDAFTVYQEILFTQSEIRINNIVSFGPTIGQLKVEASSAKEQQCNSLFMEGEAHFAGKRSRFPAY